MLIDVLEYALSNLSPRSEGEIILCAALNINSPLTPSQNQRLAVLLSNTISVLPISLRRRYSPAIAISLANLGKKELLKQLLSEQQTSFWKARLVDELNEWAKTPEQQTWLQHL